INLVKNYTCSDAHVEYDNGKIVQVIINLLSNAIKFSPPESTLTITLENTTYNNKPALIFAIQDQGIGISADELEKVFDKFVQSSKTKSQAGGTGLGLSICNEIIRGHGGKIWAESKEGEGSTFKFILPKQAATKFTIDESTTKAS
ncbi:MAG: sensor histidine kinase, partial [Rickettsiales bacterium]